MTKTFDFIFLGFSIFAMFVLGFSSSTHVLKFMGYMNDVKIDKTIEDWLIFGLLALVATIIWTGLWLLFKVSEKRCMSHFDNKK